MTKFFNSTIGKKFVMAFSGLAVAGFLVGHMAGNLQVFGPPEMINKYAHTLKTMPLILWGTRIGLLFAIAMHILTAIELSALNKSARPVGYAGKSSYGASFASKYMMLGGLTLLAFIVYHLAHFTVLVKGINGVGDFRSLTADLDGQTVPDVYAMMVLGFQVWWVALFYLIAQTFLYLHLSHGLQSMFQSLGLRNHVWWPRIQLVAKVGSIGLFVGFISIPIAVQLRLVGKDYAESKRAQLETGAPTIVAAEVK